MKKLIKISSKNDHLKVFIDTRALILLILTILITIAFRTFIDSDDWLILDIFASFGWSIIICLPFYKWFLTENNKDEEYEN